MSRARTKVAEHIELHRDGERLFVPAAWERKLPLTKQRAMGGWAVDVFDGRRAWTKTHLGESPLSKAEAHRLAHKLRDPKFYTARAKRAVNSGGAL